MSRCRCATSTSIPTIAKLAEHLKSSAPETTVETPREPLHIASNLAYYGCGALQALSYVAYGVFWLWLMTRGFEWTYDAIDNVAVAYLRIVAFGAGSFVLFSAIPIAAKWLLIGRWKEEVIPIWSLRYFRFWLVEGAHSQRPDGAADRQPALQRLSSPARRQDRPPQP